MENEMKVRNVCVYVCTHTHNHLQLSFFIALMTAFSCSLEIPRNDDPFIVLHTSSKQEESKRVFHSFKNQLGFFHLTNQSSNVDSLLKWHGWSKCTALGLVIIHRTSLDIVPAKNTWHRKRLLILKEKNTNILFDGGMGRTKNKEGEGERIVGTKIHYRW